MFTGKSFLRL